MEFGINLLIFKEIGQRTKLDEEDKSLLEDTIKKTASALKSGIIALSLLLLVCFYLYQNTYGTEETLMGIVVLFVLLGLGGCIYLLMYNPTALEKAANEKVVWEGILSEKRSEWHSTGTGTTRRNYWSYVFRFDDKIVSVPQNYYDSFEVGQKVILHALPKQNIVFKVTLATQ